MARRLRELVPTSATTARLEGRDVVVFCANDYLGLSWHPEVRAAFSRGGGAGSARLVSGHRPVHAELEARLEALYGKAALLFPSGYQANLALFATVCGPGEMVASDALNHASIIDGLRLSKAQRRVIPHQRPAEIPSHARLAVVEGLFSMDGDIPRFSEWTGSHWLAVDEAHAFGTLGPGGRGAAAAQGVDPDFIVGTFGKAMGSAGAFVVGPPELKSLLTSAGRAFVYTTAMPEPVVHAALAGLNLANDERRERLAENSRRLRNGLLEVGATLRGEAHIVPVITGERTMEIAAKLLNAGIYAAGIRYPTVPRGQERVRLTVSAEHTAEQIEQCVSAVGAAIG